MYNTDLSSVGRASDCSCLLMIRMSLVRIWQVGFMITKLKKLYTKIQFFFIR
jgi:hypothetical protein